MKYRQLGSSDIKVSEISLGSWLTFGSGVEREKGVGCLKKAFDLGITHIDTANIYGVGAAETFLGEALKDYPRKKYVLGTKVFWPMSPTDSRAAHPTMKQHFNDQGLPFGDDNIFAAVEKLEPIAKRCGITMAQLAIAWVLRQPNVASAIVGVSRPEQLETNAKGSGIKLDGDTLGEIDRALDGVVSY